MTMAPPPRPDRPQSPPKPPFLPPPPEAFQNPFGPPPQYPSRPQNLPGIFALVAAVVGVVLVLVADSTPVISASGPALFAVFAGAAGAVLGIVGIVQGNRRGLSIVLAVIGLIIGGLVFVGGIAEYAAIQHQLDVARQCLSDLIACGQQH